MSGFACPRCLGAHMVIAFNGHDRFPCPSCAPPHLRKAAINLDVLDILQRLDAIDADVALEFEHAAFSTRKLPPEA